MVSETPGDLGMLPDVAVYSPKSVLAQPTEMLCVRLSLTDYCSPYPAKAILKLAWLFKTGPNQCSTVSSYKLFFGHGFVKVPDFEELLGDEDLTCPPD